MVMIRLKKSGKTLKSLLKVDDADVQDVGVMICCQNMTRYSMLLYITSESLHRSRQVKLSGPCV